MHDSILHASGYHDIDTVTWWNLKHRGIAVVGPLAEYLDIQVDWDGLIAKMHHNLNTYHNSLRAGSRTWRMERCVGLHCGGRPRLHHHDCGNHARE